MELKTAALRKTPKQSFMPVLSMRQLTILLSGTGLGGLFIFIFALLGAGTVGAVLGLALFFFLYYMLSDTTHETPNHWRFRHFAKDNGFKFKDGLDYVDLPPLLGGLNFERQDYEFHMGGRIGRHNFSLFVGNFSTPRSSGYRVQEAWIFHTKLSAELPHFVVDARYNTIKQSKDIKNYQKIDLEGDFSSYFHLYCPKGEQINTLSVMTPDIMQALKEFWQYTDVIVDGDDVWLLGTNEADDHEDVQHLFDTAVAVLPELQHRAATYKWDTV